MGSGPLSGFWFLEARTASGACPGALMARTFCAHFGVVDAIVMCLGAYLRSVPFASSFAYQCRVALSYTVWLGAVGTHALWIVGVLTTGVSLWSPSEGICFVPSSVGSELLSECCRVASSALTRMPF